jgi:hypothetical protein
MPLFDFLSLEYGIPFFFIFAIIYGALEIGGVFKNKGVKAIISICLAFFAVSNYQVLALINQLLPYAAIFFIVVFFLGFILKPFIGKGGKGDPVLLIIVLGLVLLLFAQLGSPSSPFYHDIQSTILGNENFLWIVGIIIVIVMFVYAYRMGKGGE